MQEYAGSTSFANVSNRDKRLEIGWTWIGKKFQKTGLNRNGKLLMLQYAFETLQFERVELKTDERNMASRTAIEKIGGKFEGILRSHMVVKDGFRRNTVYYSILSKEWPGVKTNLLNKM
jgi:RimJ/RimL family protein N-acetyltransferase